MEKELLQIAWQDDWWAESPTPELDDDDEEEEDDDLMLSDVEKDDGGAARAGGIAERVLADAREDDVAAPLEAAPDVEMEDGGATDLADDDDDQDEDEDEEEERAFLLRWYSAAESPPLPEGGAASVEAEPAPAPVPATCHERFSLETPSTLLGAMLSQSTAADRRVIHERVLVHAAMHALRGVATPCRARA
ncbi:hypothetical protein ATCC90586_011325 [Pythium insidiosum]|nr:hypothetical protein ATCC90586_011325 [Pythium insidiosum]